MIADTLPHKIAWDIVAKMGTPPNADATVKLTVGMAQVIASHITETYQQDAKWGREWRKNSSLEKWFPISAEEIIRLRTAVKNAQEALKKAGVM